MEEEKLEAHSDWVRDVAWAPNVGLPVSTIATCSQVKQSGVGNKYEECLSMTVVVKPNQSNDSGQSRQM